MTFALRGPIGAALQREIDAIHAIEEVAALPLLAAEIQRGIGFGGQQPELAVQFAPGVLGLIRQVPLLLEAGAALVTEGATPLATRFGIATALLYAAIPNNIIVERTGCGFGYVDEWLLLQAAILQYTGRPALAGATNDELATMSQFLTCCLPADAIANLQLALTGLGQQCAVLPFVPADQLSLMLDALLRSPVPQQWIPPTPQPPPGVTPPSSGRGEWTVTPTAATWSNNRGSTYMRFSSGDSVMMSGNNILVTSSR